MNLIAFPIGNSKHMSYQQDSYKTSYIELIGGIGW